MRALLVLAIVLAPLAAASAAPPDVAGATRCKARGFSTDLDPKGTNVRNAPRADAPIVGVLAPRMRIAPDTYTGVEFEILGSKDGWLLIDAATTGRGWVWGRLVGVTLGSRRLLAGPRRDAALVARLAGDNWGPGSVAVSAVHACQDDYVEVTGTPIGGKPLRGWSRSPCASQLTTCDRGDQDD